LSHKIDEKHRMKEMISTHKTGLPDKLLKLFEARPLPEHTGPPMRKTFAVPYSGLAAYIDEFAEPGADEYEPPRPDTVPKEPRVFRNPELVIQARVDVETKPEK
jgi:U1 small nuclear ribonucleoprotein 70kDa